MLSLLVAIIGKSSEAHGDDMDKVLLFPVAGLVLRYEKLLSEKQVNHFFFLDAIVIMGFLRLLDSLCVYSEKSIAPALLQGILTLF